MAPAVTEESMTDGSRLASARPLSEQAYERIRDDIVYLRLEPGEPLDDKVLSSSLGMSLTPVRDALKRLTLERMVVTYPRRGTFVAEITVSDEQWLTEIRQNLEGVAAGLAAERATETERESLTELASRLADDHTNHVTTAYHALDSDIHKAIYAAAHNPFLEASLTQYLNLTIPHLALRAAPRPNASRRRSRPAGRRSRNRAKGRRRCGRGRSRPSG